MKRGKNIISQLLLVVCLVIAWQSVNAAVQLPALVSDGMVLQRNAKVNIWGWASPGEEITVRFLGKTYQATAGDNSRWSVKLAPMAAGGPYSMQIDGDNHIVLSDILVGEVWICSGQSNMVLPMERVRPLYEDLIEQSENEYIRHFKVPMSYDFSGPQQDLLAGDWKAANPWNLLDFSATAYFFAKSLYQKYQLPNYGRASQTVDAPSGWARIREAQRQTLELPNTGMAITIGLGEWNDVHPLNKKDVGERLFLAAQKVAYEEEEITASGPLYQSTEVDGQKVILSFSEVGQGLVAKESKSLQGFSIAGEGEKFIEAKAKIIARDSVVVWSNKISDPAKIRYAWTDNPERANLYNEKGLPASPFEIKIPEDKR